MPAQASSDATAASSQTITVSANFGPEELEDLRISKVESPLLVDGTLNDCSKSIDAYQTQIIPLANASKFPKVKAKYLFEAYGAIGRCYLSDGHYPEAEHAYKLQLESAELWPGKEDSSYPGVFLALGVAQAHEQHFPDAQENLQKAVIHYDNHIEAAEQSKSADDQKSLAPHLRSEEDVALSQLAFVYFREGRIDDALRALEQAYEQAIKSPVPPDVFQEIVQSGRYAAKASGKADVIAIWAARPEKQD